jgi:hypothetical protein
MIETRKYSPAEEFDRKSIWDSEFEDRLKSLTDEGKVSGVYIERGNYQPRVFHIAPGLTATVQEDNYPIIAHGNPKHFSEGEKILEQLLNTTLTGETI